MVLRRVDDLEEFIRVVQPRLVRALIGQYGIDGAADAAAEALEYAVKNWDRVRLMDRPAGYLYRVAQSRSRQKKQGLLPMPDELGVPDVEPGLVRALQALPETQRVAVWLVHACGWSYVDAAQAMATSTSMVGNHVSRALKALRRELGVEANV